MRPTAGGLRGHQHARAGNRYPRPPSAVARPPGPSAGDGRAFRNDACSVMFLNAAMAEIKPLQAAAAAGDPDAEAYFRRLPFSAIAECFLCDLPVGPPEQRSVAVLPDPAAHGMAILAPVCAALLRAAAGRAPRPGASDGPRYVAAHEVVAAQRYRPGLPSWRAGQVRSSSRTRPASRARWAAAGGVTEDRCWPAICHACCRQGGGPIGAVLSSKHT
jgi:hypothetical protein